MRSLWILLAALTLTACVPSTQRAATPTEPYPFNVPLVCRTPCAPLPRIEPDQPDGSAPWDVIGLTAADQDAQVHDRCDAARDACVRALWRLDHAGVIKISGGRSRE